MAEFREAIPTISGPGTFLIFLIFLALILTSDESLASILTSDENNQLNFNWSFAAALAAISLPTSIFITQIYRGCFEKFGVNKSDWGEEYTEYKRDMLKLYAMVDYLSHKNGKGDKEWVIIQKRATAYHLFSMLRYVSFSFLFCYTIIIFLIWTGWCGHTISISCSGLGVASMIVIALLSGIVFHFSSKDVWNVWMILDKKIIRDRDIKLELDAWIKEEIDKNRNEN